MEKSQSLIATISSIRETIADSEVDLVAVNMARTLTNFRESMVAFIQSITRHKRHMATHIFVLMISSEQRDSKPYAMPVQCLPYHSINQRQMRQIVSALVKEMVSRGMKVAGKFLVSTICAT